MFCISLWMHLVTVFITVIFSKNTDTDHSLKGHDSKIIGMIPRKCYTFLFFKDLMVFTLIILMRWDFTSLSNPQIYDHTHWLWKWEHYNLNVNRQYATTLHACSSKYDCALRSSWRYQRTDEAISQCGVEFCTFQFKSSWKSCFINVWEFFFQILQKFDECGKTLIICWSSNISVCFCLGRGRLYCHFLHLFYSSLTGLWKWERVIIIIMVDFISLWFSLVFVWKHVSLWT